MPVPTEPVRVSTGPPARWVWLSWPVPPCGGRREEPGGDGHRAGGERGGVDLERRGDVELADALGEPDTERRPAPRCEGGEEVGEVTWGGPLRGDAGGAIQ